MKVTNAGYKDPSNLTFDDIVILGVPRTPGVSLTTLSGRDINLSNATVNYDGVKQVNTDIVVEKHIIKTISILVFSCQGKLQK